jgi:hypothetical protein
MPNGYCGQPRLGFASQMVSKKLTRRIDSDLFSD